MAHLIESSVIEDSIIPQLIPKQGASCTYSMGDFINALIRVGRQLYKGQVVGIAPLDLKMALQSLRRAGHISYEEGGELIKIYQSVKKIGAE